MFWIPAKTKEPIDNLLLETKNKILVLFFLMMSFFFLFYNEFFLKNQKDVIAKNAEKSLKQLLDAISVNKLVNVEVAIEENENEAEKEQDNNEKIEGDYEVEETLINMD